MPYGVLRAATFSPVTPLRIPRAVALEALLAGAGAGAAARLSDGLVDAPPEWRRTFVVGLPAGSSPDAARALASGILGGRLAESAARDPVFEPLVVKDFDWGAGGVEGTGTSGAGRAAVGSGGIAASRIGFFPDDPLFAGGGQWGLYNTGLGEFGGVTGVDVRAPEAWTRFAGGTATILGVVDTGIDPAHPELNRTLFDGTPRLVAALSSVSAGESPADSVGHGTMVNGVTAAITNNGPQLDGRGVASVAGGAGGDSTGVRLVSVKTTPGHSTDASGADLARAIVLAHQFGARAVNVSFGGDEPSGLVRDACRWVTERGTAVVFGAGNSGDSRLQYPGAYARFGVAVSVGAIDQAGELAVFSTYGDQVDVVGPGVDIWSTWPTYANARGSLLRNYAHTSGTSFSAPLVTGMAGLAYGLRPDLAGNDFQQILRRTARDWGPSGRDEFFGNGFVDAAALVDGLLPPWGLARGTAPAGSWSSAGVESLRVFESGIYRGGYSVDGDHIAERFEVRGRAEFPPSVLGTPQVWVRPTGPGGWSAGRVHEANIPWGEVVPGSASEYGAELFTNVYRIDAPPPDCPSCPSIGWLPRPPEQVEMEWTAWSRQDAPPAVRVLRPRPGEIWNAGSYQQVQWEATDPDEVSHVRISWTANEGGELHRVTVGSSTSPSGSITVVAPCRIGSGEIRIAVAAYDSHGRAYDLTIDEVPIQITGAECPAAAYVPLALEPPRPNPARGYVTLHLQVGWEEPAAYLQHGAIVPAAGVTISDVRGARVRRLPVIAGPALGQAHAGWDGMTDDGAAAPSGVYILRVDLGAHAAVRRLVWLR